MIRKLLVPVRGDGKGANLLAHAAPLARRFGAHVEVTHCRPRPEDLMPYGVPVPAFLREQMQKQSAELADQEEARLREEFTRLCAQHGLTVATPTVAGVEPTASWVEEAGRQIDVVKHHGRLADLVVVAKPDRSRNLGTNTLRVALFNTARPVLMCPPREAPLQALGDVVALAWNGSLEATRAVTAAHDILASAQKVVVLTAGREELHGATTDELIDYLALRGVTAEAHRFTTRARPGEALLKETASVGADTLIMGAYGDSHERETIFGGNTQIVVDTATMPVVFVH